MIRNFKFLYIFLMQLFFFLFYYHLLFFISLVLLWFPCVKNSLMGIDKVHLNFMEFVCKTRTFGTYLSEINLC